MSAGGGAPRRGLTALLGAAALAWTAGCFDLSTDPDEILSISFGDLPAPGVVAGDTLRDSLGVAAPLRAVAFDARGDTVGDAAATFIVLDTALARVSPTTGLLVARDTTGSARLVADVAGIQSTPVTIEIVPSPDTAVRGDSATPLAYVADTKENASANTTVEGDTVRIQHKAANGTLSAVRAWVVSYAVYYQGALLTDTTLAYPVDGSGRLSRIDTTDASGIAVRQIRVHPAKLAKATDTLVVVATARRPGGSAVPGTPARFIVPLAPKSP